jgi:hypothetical protein
MRVIAINDAFKIFPRADVLYFCDVDWWKKNRLSVQERFLGKVIVTMNHVLSGVKTLRETGALGLETDPGGIRHGNNSGYAAINLAYHFGAKRIVLLGYDMRVPNGKTHWHDRDNGRDAQDFDHVLRNEMLPCFRYLHDPLKAAGVEVINATPNSALTLWPYRALGTIS